MPWFISAGSRTTPHDGSTKMSRFRLSAMMLDQRLLLNRLKHDGILVKTFRWLLNPLKRKAKATARDPHAAIAGFLTEIGRKGGMAQSQKKGRAARRNLAEARRVRLLTPSQKRRREAALERWQSRKKRDGSKNVETQDSTQKVSFGNPKAEPPSEGS